MASRGPLHLANTAVPEFTRPECFPNERPHVPRNPGTGALRLAAAVVVEVIFRVLKLPALLAAICSSAFSSGRSIGPIADNEETRYLAEFGVVFLMFSIGLEFSLPS